MTSPRRVNPLDNISLGKIVQIRERLLKAQAAGREVFRFESGDPDFSIAPNVLEGLKKAAETGKTHYIPNNGIPELRKALARKVREHNGIPADEDDVFVTNGAMHGLFVTFQAILEPGDEVIVPEPMWTEVVENIRLAGGVPVPVRLLPEEGYRYSPERIAAKITDRTKAIFSNTPHNPTGAVASRTDLEAIRTLGMARNLWLVSDEAYEDVLFEPAAHVSLGSLVPESYPRLVSVFSFSKSHAMSGLRVGYLVCREATFQDRVPKALRCTINGVNSVAQWTALAAVTGDRAHLEYMRGEYLKRRDLLFSALEGIPGLKPFRPQGTFFLWAEVEPSLLQRLGAKSVDELSNRLAEVGLGSSPGDAFGESCANAIRFAFSCSTKMIQEGAPKLRTFLLGT